MKTKMSTAIGSRKAHCNYRCSKPAKHYLFCELCFNSFLSCEPCKKYWKRRLERFVDEAGPEISELLHTGETYYFCPNCEPEIQGSVEYRSFLIRRIM